MPSNQIPEDVREQFDSLLKKVGMGGLGRLAAKDALDDIAPLIIEWARKDALLSAAETFMARLPDGTSNGRAYNSYTVAEMLRARAQFTPETTGGEW